MSEAPLYVVTGAGRGLGLAIAERLGRDGARIVVAELRSEVAEQGLAQLTGLGIEAHRVDTDVADADSVAALGEAVAALGGAHGLVNNAALADGVGGLPFHQIPEDAFSRVLDVNVRGTWLVSRALYAQIAQHRGAIVNLASDAALYGSPRLAHYIASKGAIISMTRAMARDAGPDEVRVNAVAPGLTRVEATETVPDERYDLYRTGRALDRDQTPEDTTGAVAFLLSDDARYITGQTLVVDGGFVMH
ncbi:short-chain dehydrogenase [Aeromicrobium sp. PE09-221]|uniref:3-oxoacyl-ACP reductase family protein n=1 Tax=Aeromicrobium sp. PE09-221 TaxID=1898043 RepID=UPI000B3E5957|nr:3-oxoacyl-ACP reductase family protein [Aeromicrobium sp. PE09-221]OUZ09256.1 short-chain dehydrogenase [Aeromicrobium sp. PE09-221]